MCPAGVSKDMKRHGQTGALSAGAAVILGAGQSLAETKLRPSFAGAWACRVYSYGDSRAPRLGELIICLVKSPTHGKGSAQEDPASSSYKQRGPRWEEQLHVDPQEPHCLL